MHPIDIQARMKKKGITQARLAEDLGVRPMCVSKVINQSMVSDRIMRAVARAIDKDHREVFPYYLKPPKRRTSKVSSV